MASTASIITQKQRSLKDLSSEELGLCHDASSLPKTAQRASSERAALLQEKTKVERDERWWWWPREEGEREFNWRAPALHSSLYFYRTLTLDLEGMAELIG